ncbi:OVARIAN CANCER GENE-2 PROTEIN-RELATED [Salix koriyanagi]|uniref:OVARIAN CANCER GENE-2 PROTEIN-RELATED n=1 Tax=Salix koriyanagi TaxID=2511006 RepID=A0A9Q0YSD8_9ROSI|nr:OVARIAN CANCER GENE-2 PROTEIN-RELATED [Salix koriyanagi]
MGIEFHIFSHYSFSSSGKTDFLKEYGMELVKKCVDPVVIHHPKGHTIPRLDEKGLETMLSFVDKIQNELLDM